MKSWSEATLARFSFEEWLTWSLKKKMMMTVDTWRDNVVRNEIEFCHSWHGSAKVSGGGVRSGWRWLIKERAAARSGASWHGVTTHRFDLYNSRPRWWSLLSVAWPLGYARTPASLCHATSIRMDGELILTDCSELLGSRVVAWFELCKGV